MRKPTIKQARVINDLLENTGKPISKAMRDAGYAPATAKNPKELTNSKTWIKWMNKYLPDDLLGKKHKELLNKKEVIIRNNNKTGKVETVKTGEIDANAVKAGLDMAYKLKGKYAPDKLEQTIMGVTLSANQAEQLIRSRAGRGNSEGHSD